MCVHKNRVALSQRFLRSIILSKCTLMVFLLIKNLYKLSLALCVADYQAASLCLDSTDAEYCPWERQGCSSLWVRREPWLKSHSTASCRQPGRGELGRGLERGCGIPQEGEFDLLKMVGGSREGAKGNECVSDLGPASRSGERCPLPPSQEGC